MNEPIQYNHHKKGRIKEPFIDALLYAYSQNTGVTLADIEQQKEILNARNAIWNHVTQYGRDVLLSIAEEDNPAIREAIEEREKERPTRQEQATMEEREAEAELTDERMADLSRRMGAAFGRLQAELVQPVLQRVIYILIRSVLGQINEEMEGTVEIDKKQYLNVGKALNTKIAVDVGEIIRVKVDEVKKKGDGFSLFSAKPIEIPEVEHPDKSNKTTSTTSK